MTTGELGRGSPAGTLRWLLLAALAPAASAARSGDEEPSFSSFLVVEDVENAGRAPLFRDPVELALAEGRFSPPAEGDPVAAAPGSEVRRWRSREVGEDGALPLRGGYAFATVAADEEEVRILEASGHRSVVVNGEPRVGDVYQLGITQVPVLLRAGTNEFLFQGGRGRLSARLRDPPADVFFAAQDRTLPDVIRGEDEGLLAGVLVLNATTEWQRGLQVEAGSCRTPLPPLPPLCLYKAGVDLRVAPDSAAERVTVELTLRDARGSALHATTLELAVRAPTETHSRTFRSAIDGSVQYYAVTPPASPTGDTPPALFLSLHGAGVEAVNQARCYAPKEGGVVVAPTNRRPYGFDWEDWGRLDALEVLEQARRRWHPDPRRIYLTGHSMGGHGTWSLGALFPDQFAALAPSAGWRDFGSYAGSEDAEATGVAALLRRAASASQTLLLEDNYRLPGIYILHGDQDDNVPVEQARFMRSRLAQFHTNFCYYERPGAGHWWGNECMDWPPLFEFLRQNTLPAAADLRSLEFVTVNPGISARCHWLEIHTQESFLEPSSLQAAVSPDEHRITVKTRNVHRFALDVAFLPEGPVEVSVDGTTPGGLERPAPGEALRFERGAEEEWHAVPAFPAGEKSPARSGPFKDAFRRHVRFVVGTAGSAAENAWALAKARYDAETFWYRGNGAVEVLLDTEFSASADPDHDVVLYGNADTHRSWRELLAGSPVQVHRGEVQVGERHFPGEDLGVLFLRPRPGSDTACVAVVGGTGLPGSRCLDALPYFVSGVGYPDWIVLRAEFLRSGVAGVPAAGFFGPDWSLRPDDTVLER